MKKPVLESLLNKVTALVKGDSNTGVCAICEAECKS